MDSVDPESIAERADRQHNDVLVMVNEVKIISFKQAVRLIKQAMGKVVLRVERCEV